jgi:hypothetical protein
MAEKNEKLLKLVDKLDEAVELAEKVMSDGKVDFMDTVHAPEAIKLLLEIIDLVKEHKELMKEIKSLDGEGAIDLIKKALDL